MAARAALAAVVAVLLAVPAAAASTSLRVGIVDNAGAFYEPPEQFYPLLRDTGAQVLRVNLNWGGKLGVARFKPLVPADPEDRAYDWRLYDRVVLEAAARGIEVVFSIFGTPAWANGGARPNRAPRDEGKLADFAYAAALRYGGGYARPDGQVLPPVRRFIAWNEPNLRLGLIPQWRRVGGRWTIRSAVDYARVCNAVVDGVRAAAVPGDEVACGVTSARGNNNPRSQKPSVSPLAFMRALKAAGAHGFDAYAAQPYAGSPRETPTTPPPARTAVTLATIDRLVDEVDRLWGPKVRIWITEYGYETNPPDRAFGVPYAKQAAYLQQAVSIAQANPRIDLLLWFLLRDEPRIEGWQSGLVTARGARKPAYAAFRRAVASLTP